METFYVGIQTKLTAAKNESISICFTIQTDTHTHTHTDRHTATHMQRHTQRHYENTSTTYAGANKKLIIF